MFVEPAADDCADREPRRGAEHSPSNHSAGAWACRIARRAKLGAGVGTEEAQSDATDQAPFEPIGPMWFRRGKSIRELEGGDGWERWRQVLRSCGASAEQQADKHNHCNEFEHHP